MGNAKVTKNGNGQTVQIPADLAFENTTDLIAYRIGKTLVLKPAHTPNFQEVPRENKKSPHSDFLAKREPVFQFNENRLKPK